MTKHARDLLDYANSRRDQVVGNCDQVVGFSDQVAAFDHQVRQLCKKLWKPKAAQNLSIYGDVTVRQAERLLGGKQGFSRAVYQRLCRCPDGEVFLRLWMDGCTANFWLTMLDDHDVGEIERRSEELHREAEELKRRRSAPGRGGRS
jgi:hypothetical protein